jgi:hypothetical protein
MKSLNIDNIPLELRSNPRWVVWKHEGSAGKIPYSAKTGHKVNITKADAGSEFSVACERYASGLFSGVGFILNGDGVVAADLDDCVTDGCIDPRVHDVLQLLGSGYLEYSPSGRGVHMWGRCATRSDGCRGEINGISVELYSDRRYITITSESLSGANVDLPALTGYDVVLNKMGRFFDTSSVVDHTVLAGSADDLADKVLFTQEAQDNQDKQETQVIQEMQEIDDGHEIEASSTSLEIQKEFPPICFVTKPGQRHTKLFQLARWLMAELPNPNEALLRLYVQEWHKRFVVNMNTKDFDVTWLEFVNSWKHIRYPMGEVLDHAVNNPFPLPAWMSGHRLGAFVDELLGVCLRLAAKSPDGIFFLASRPLAEKLGCSHQFVQTNLNGLVRYGYLELIYKGHTGRASEYRIGIHRVDPFVR